MNFARRTFLQLIAGFTGGTLLTPLPWKLAEDSAIWSQNWWWRPSPSRGEITKTPTICRLCDGGCGIQARLVEKQRAIFLEGNPDHPVNRGGICPLGAAGLQFLYAPYRIDQPMKQTKKRGDASGFQRISWDEAQKELASKIQELRSAGKPNSMACISGIRRSSMNDLWKRFFFACGSPNFFTMPALEDSISLAAGLALGRQAPVGFGIERASYILSFGADLIEGWGSSARMQAAYGNLRKESSAKVVQVESRCSMTATKADRWIAVSPGTEAALALAMAHVMIKENLYDSGYVASKSFGFEDWHDAQGRTRKGFKTLVLSNYAPEQAAQQTGVDPGTIREIAREFASRENAVAVWGDNQADEPGNIYHDLSFLALNALKGNLKAGGMIGLIPTPPLPQLPDMQLDKVAEVSIAKKRLDLAEPESAPLPGNAVHGFLDTLAKGGTYPIDLLLVYEANPAYSLPQNESFEAALAKTGCLVSFSSYMDETAMQADLVLPNHNSLERLDDVMGLPATLYNYYAVSTPILPPRTQTRHTGDVILQVAKTLGGSVSDSIPWTEYEEFLKFRVNGLASNGKGAVADKQVDLSAIRPGQIVVPNYTDGSDLWAKLKSGKCWYDAPSDLPADLKTTSGKYEFACQWLEARGLIVDDDQAYLPHFAVLPPAGTEIEFPLQLVTYRTMFLTSDYLANPPFMTKTVPNRILNGHDMLVEINPDTARSLGLEEGAQAVLKTPQKAMPVRIHIFHGARPGVVYIVQGLGHQAYDVYIQDKGVNANSLIDVRMDPVTGLGTLGTTQARLSRA